jgi:hypothetical protein
MWFGESDPMAGWMLFAVVALAMLLAAGAGIVAGSFF